MHKNPILHGKIEAHFHNHDHCFQHPSVYETYGNGRDKITKLIPRCGLKRVRESSWFEWFVAWRIIAYYLLASCRAREKKWGALMSVRRQDKNNKKEIRRSFLKTHHYTAVPDQYSNLLNVKWRRSFIRHHCASTFPCKTVVIIIFHGVKCLISCWLVSDYLIPGRP